jgi:uncharacterized protein
MLKGKKVKKLNELVAQFFAEIRETLPELGRLIEDYLQDDRQFKEDAYRVHIHEHEADILRRRVMGMMYKGTLLPFYREDYIVLLALGDRIANLAEEVASNLVLTRPRIPDFLHEGLKKLAAACFETYRPLEWMVLNHQEKNAEIPRLMSEVNERETMADRLQWDLVKAVFKSDLPLAEKQQMKELIDKIAGISDHIEDTAERLEIMLVKQPI